MRKIMAAISNTILYFPHQLAEIIIPLDIATVRSPLTANSLPIITTAIHAETLSSSTSGMRAAVISILSAIGSNNLPRVVTWFVLLARCPSNQSVNEAIPNIMAANRGFIFWEDIRNTRNKGIRNILISVILFGRFSLYMIKKFKGQSSKFKIKDFFKT